MKNYYQIKNQEIISIAKATIEDTKDIIALGNSLYKGVKDNTGKGFLSIKFDENIVRDFIVAPGVISRNEKGDIIGFLFNSSLTQDKYEGLLRHVYDNAISQEFNGKKIIDYKWVFYGPIAVAPNYQGQGIPALMFEEAKRFLLVNKYDLAIAFIDKENPVSLNVHINKMGFKEISSFIFYEKLYTLIGYDLNKT
jgi:GNAT superfamily N-acetyltransferase